MEVTSGSISIDGSYFGDNISYNSNTLENSTTWTGVLYTNQVNIDISNSHFANNKSSTTLSFIVYLITDRCQHHTGEAMEAR